MIEIVDPSGKRRKVKYVKLKVYEEWDAVNKVPIKKKWVEVEIIGNRGTWKQWYEPEEFKRLNPHIKIEGEKQ